MLQLRYIMKINVLSQYRYTNIIGDTHTYFGYELTYNDSKNDALLVMDYVAKIWM